MPNTRLIALNGNAGDFVDIKATVFCRQVQLIEDDAAAAQGVALQFPEDNFTATHVFGATTQPVSIPDPRRYPNAGRVLGMPEQGEVGATNRREADVLCKARSATANPTTLRVIEYE